MLRFSAQNLMMVIASVGALQCLTGCETTTAQAPAVAPTPAVVVRPTPTPALRRAETGDSLSMAPISGTPAPTPVAAAPAPVPAAPASVPPLAAPPARSY